ncbi:PadR family transcriptional regulator [Lactobacillus sp. DCY120]|uniref:PadR family transcriptional regulator n=1 Tax=Bombilactobacillus apium TaxID=2675299 RepID=A0A850R0I9_9LACO|nr:PadR family transcriptional regulator [Bombilactobacillus apium]NVY96579.1 PadR family transcriptional regulator [Bombilactobacillus apium]
MNPQLKKGLLDVCVLAQLQRSESTLYTILKRLLAQGAITVKKQIYHSHVRKYYRITAIGEDKITQFIADWDSVEAIVHFIQEGAVDDKS